MLLQLGPAQAHARVPGQPVLLAIQRCRQLLDPAARRTHGKRWPCRHMPSSRHAPYKTLHMHSGKSDARARRAWGGRGGGNGTGARRGMRQSLPSCRSRLRSTPPPHSHCCTHTARHAHGQGAPTHKQRRQAAAAPAACAALRCLVLGVLWRSTQAAAQPTHEAKHKMCCDGNRWAGAGGGGAGEESKAPAPLAAPVDHVSSLLALVFGAVQGLAMLAAEGSAHWCSMPPQPATTRAALYSKPALL